MTAYSHRRQDIFHLLNMWPAVEGPFGPPNNNKRHTLRTDLRSTGRRAAPVIEQHREISDRATSVRARARIKMILN